MKKIAASILAIAAFAFSATAQSPDNTTASKNNMHKEWHHHHKGMDMQQLNLTQTQKDELKTSREAFKKQLQELNKNERITVKESRDKKYALKQQQKKYFLSILTPEQKTTLAQLKQQKQQQHELMAAKKLDKMKEKLNLTDQQVTQIKADRASIHEQLKTIRENENLTRTEKKDQLQTLKNQSKEDFKKILTPDQLNKLDEMKQNRMNKES